MKKLLLFVGSPIGLHRKLAQELIIFIAYASSGFMDFTILSFGFKIHCKVISKFSIHELLNHEFDVSIQNFYRVKEYLFWTRDFKLIDLLV